MKGIILCALSGISFGLAFSLAPLIYGAGGNPIILSFLRNFFALPFLILLIVLLKVGFKINKKQLLSTILLGVFGNATTALMLNIAISYVDVGIVMPLHFTYPLFVFLGMVVFYKEKISMKNIIALILAMIGVACFFASAFENLTNVSSGILLGLILALLSGITYAFYIIYMDKCGLKSENPFKISFYVSLSSGLSILIYGILINDLPFYNLTTKAWVLSLFFALLCNVIALSFLQLGIKHIGANMAAIITTFEPLTGVIGGAIILGESITVIKIIACVFIFAGVIILSRK